jgi:hypothetical protein
MHEFGLAKHRVIFTRIIALFLDHCRLVLLEGGTYESRSECHLPAFWSNRLPRDKTRAIWGERNV